MSTVAEEVIAILAGQALCDPTDIDPAASIESLGLDSLALVEAIFAIEETFGISVPFNANQPEHSDFDIATVASVVEGVRRLVAEKG